MPRNLHERVRAGKRVDEFIGGYAESCSGGPYSEGWALVGDAGTCYGVTSGHGIANAFRQAAQISEAVAEGLANERSMADALADFEKTRNEVEGAFYHFTYEQATLEPPSPEAIHLFGSIHKSQDATNAFLGLFAQTSGPADFFSPANLSKLTGA